MKLLLNIAEKLHFTLAKVVEQVFRWGGQLPSFLVSSFLKVLYIKNLSQLF